MVCRLVTVPQCPAVGSVAGRGTRRLRYTRRELPGLISTPVQLVRGCPFTQKPRLDVDCLPSAVQ